MGYRSRPHQLQAGTRLAARLRSPLGGISLFRRLVVQRRPYRQFSKVARYATRGDRGHILHDRAAHCQ
jgi:hypothetical protein